MRCCRAELQPPNRLPHSWLPPGLCAGMCSGWGVRLCCEPPLRQLVDTAFLVLAVLQRAPALCGLLALLLWSGVAPALLGVGPIGCRISTRLHPVQCLLRSVPACQNTGGRALQSWALA
jgi:hypothetical protein